jgi:hypothetical protein
LKPNLSIRRHIDFVKGIISRENRGPSVGAQPFLILPRTQRDG